MAETEERQYSSESTLFSELRRYIQEIIMVLQQSGPYGNDFIQFRLDWLCNIEIV